MLIHEHIRIVAVWFGARTKGKVRHEAERTTTVVGDQNARDRADNFAQLRRLGHHRYQLWRRQQRGQRLEVVPEVGVYELVALPTALEPEDVGHEDIAQDGLDPVESKAIDDSERQEVGTAPEGELESLQNTSEHQHEPPQTHDATPETDQLQVLENPQVISQVQSQADESDTTKESPSIVPTCATHKKQIEPQVKSILSSVTFTDSPSFSEWTPCEETDE
jgi:hypothetical protein